VFIYVLGDFMALTIAAIEELGCEVWIFLHSCQLMLEKLCGICRFHLPHFEMLVDNLNFSEKA